MLPRKLRLSRRGFSEARGLRRAASQHLSISYGLAREHGGAAAVVPKKIASSSVRRHVLKRRILAGLAPYASNERVLIVHARQGAAEIPSRELAHELISLLGSILAERK